MSKRVRIAAVGESELPRPVSPLWELVHVGVAGVVVLVTWLLLPQMPERVPIHFGVSGAPDRWIERGPAVLLVAVVPVLLLAMCLAFVHMGITRSKRSISREAPAASSYGYAAFARVQSVALVVLGLLVDALFLAMPLLMAGILSPDSYMALALGMCLIIAAGCIWMAVRYGSNGHRVAERLTGKKVVFEDVDDDALWRWGGLYWNPEDPAIWVPKRYGIGWTINAACPLAWAELFGLMAVLLVGGLAVACLA